MNRENSYEAKNQNKKKSRMPVIFSGHGSPMIALEDNEMTKTLRKVGQDVIEEYGKPKAILAISAHWFTEGSLLQSAPKPRQVYDMYGFPKELYEVKYSVSGDASLTEEVKKLLGDSVSINDEWGIDHGSWTVLVHMFPNADIPVVQLSVNRSLSPEESYRMGEKLIALREQGILIFGSGNIVHNLMRVEWDNAGGSEMAVRFNEEITKAVLEKNIDKILHYRELPDASYAVPTPDHFLPLFYCLGASDGNSAKIFNNFCNMGSMAMTGFVFQEEA